jgi:predicted dehydrogenase
MDRVRIGVLGAARIAPKAIVRPAAALADAEVVAVAARDRARAQEFATKHGIPRVADSYDALYADPEIDAIYNPLPNGLHAPTTIAALEAGKHVLCEKPFTANAADARAVADAAARSGKVVMEAFHYRYHPLFARVLELSGALGTLSELRARMIAIVPKRSDIRYQLNLAGGATMDVGSYALHQLRSVVGTEPQVVSAGATLASPGVDRAMRADLAFPDGPSARMECALLDARLPIADLRVSGERGTVHVFFPTRPDMAWISSRIDGHTARERVKGEATFWYQLQAFCDAVLRGTPVLTGPTDSVATMQAIDAVYVAAGLDPRPSP